MNTKLTPNTFFDFDEQTNAEQIISDELMKYLEKAEGKTVHFLQGEEDITAPYGIYKKTNPKAKIFSIIDLIAKEAEIDLPTHKWTEKEIAIVNNVMFSSDNNWVPIIKMAARTFYADFLRGSSIQEIPEQAQVAYFSLYANSPKFAMMSAQEATNSFIKNGWFNLNKGKTLVVDGAIGPASRAVIGKIKALSEENPFIGFTFEGYLLIAMSQRYINLAVSDSSRYLHFLRGWGNRLQHLTTF